MSRPEERVADLLVHRHQLIPPVDVTVLIELYDCELQYCEWPNKDCDAVVTGLGTGKPRIFVRDRMARVRRRFTLAHELGHVAIGWHLNTVMCDAVPDGVDDPAVLGIDQEGEANRFASRLLVPMNFRQQITDGSPTVPQVLDALEGADVSAAAGLIAIAAHLSPGIVLRTPSLAWPVFSDRTGAGIKQLAWDHDWNSLQERAAESGIADHQSQLVHWYSFWDPREPERDEDPRDTKTLLADALDLVGLEGESFRKMRMSVAGVIGAAFSDSSVADAKLLMARLGQRFESDPKFSELNSTKEFRLYLHRKVLEVAARRAP